MAGYYERRVSRAAIWCRRLAVLAVPFFILTVFLHRSESITTYQVFLLIAFGVAMLLASLAFGVRAATDLWEKGYKGGRATVNGIVLSLLLLTPFGIQLFRALEHPQLNDVSTDVITPPQFLQPLAQSRTPAVQQQNYENFQAQEIVSSYPELVARRYDAPPERVITSVLAILDRWGWQVVASVNLPVQEIIPQEEQDDEELAGGEQTGVLAPVEEEPLPELLPKSVVDPLQDMVVQARARSLVLKLKSELVIRLVASGNTTLVDMRSASLWGPHDFGRNTEDIVAFLQALDDDLAGLAGE